jgi:hypothetical protein
MFEGRGKYRAGPCTKNPEESLLCSCTPAFNRVATIENAKNVQPCGYIVKLFNEREIKAVIEVALFWIADNLHFFLKKRTVST